MESNLKKLDIFADLKKKVKSVKVSDEITSTVLVTFNNASPIGVNLSNTMISSYKDVDPIDTIFNTDHLEKYKYYIEMVSSDNVFKVHALSLNVLPVSFISSKLYKDSNLYSHEQISRYITSSWDNRIWGLLTSRVNRQNDIYTLTEDGFIIKNVPDTLKTITGSINNLEQYILDNIPKDAIYSIYIHLNRNSVKLIGVVHTDTVPAKKTVPTYSVLPTTSSFK